MVSNHSDSKSLSSNIPNIKQLDGKHDSKPQSNMSIVKPALSPPNNEAVMEGQIVKKATSSIKLQAVEHPINTLPNSPDTIASVLDPRNLEDKDSETGEDKEVDPAHQKLKRNYNDAQVGLFVLYASAEERQNYLGFGQVIKKMDQEKLTIQVRAHNANDANDLWKAYCMPATRNIYLGWKPGKLEVIYQHMIHIINIHPIPARNQSKVKRTMRSVLIPKDMMIWMADTRKKFLDTHPGNELGYEIIKIPVRNSLDPWPYHWGKVSREKKTGASGTSRRKRKVSGTSKGDKSVVNQPSEEILYDNLGSPIPSISDEHLDDDAENEVDEGEDDIKDPDYKENEDASQVSPKVITSDKDVKGKPKLKPILRRVNPSIATKKACNDMLEQLRLSKVEKDESSVHPREPSSSSIKLGEPSSSTCLSSTPQVTSLDIQGDCVREDFKFPSEKFTLARDLKEKCDRCPHTNISPSGKLDRHIRWSFLPDGVEPESCIAYGDVPTEAIDGWAFSFRWGFLIHGSESGRWMYIPTPHDEICLVEPVQPALDGETIQLNSDQLNAIRQAPLGENSPDHTMQENSPVHDMRRQEPNITVPISHQDRTEATQAVLPTETETVASSSSPSLVFPGRSTSSTHTREFCNPEVKPSSKGSSSSSSSSCSSSSSSSYSSSPSANKISETLSSSITVVPFSSSSSHVSVSIPSVDSKYTTTQQTDKGPKCMNMEPDSSLSTSIPVIPGENQSQNKPSSSPIPMKSNKMRFVANKGVGLPTQSSSRGRRRQMDHWNPPILTSLVSSDEGKLGNKESK